MSTYSLLDEDQDLFDDLYDELKIIARSHMKNEKAGNTLQATALINEAYLRMMGRENRASWETREQFLRLAASVMRRVLIDQARAKQRNKRGGGAIKLDLNGSEEAGTPITDDILAVHEALFKLEKSSPDKAEFVTLRFFGGLTIDEAADVMAISRTKAKDWWNFTRAWLYRELRH